MFKKILAYALTVCLLISVTVVPAYAVDEVYSISEDTTPVPVIYYTEDYYPGLLAQLRSSMTFANNRVAHGSYSGFNYNPSFVRVETAGISAEYGDFNSLVPSVIADSIDVSAVYTFADFYGDRVTVSLPSTDNCYFDFQSSNFVFDQQSPQANTFYVNGDLTFSLRNLWNFDSTAWYLASDPLSVQFVIDGKAYGDIIDVTGYTSPFTSLYNGGVPTDASVTFNNLKVYYQGDTPDMVGFRVYTGSAFLGESYSYSESYDIDASNTITFRVSEIPDITFVNEGGDGYAGDLSGISAVLNVISTTLDKIRSFVRIGAGYAYLDLSGLYAEASTELSISDILRQGFLGLRTILNNGMRLNSGYDYLSLNGIHVVASSSPLTLIDVLRQGVLGLSHNIRDFNSDFDSMVSWLRDSVYLVSGYDFLDLSGDRVTSSKGLYLIDVMRQGFLGLRTILNNGMRLNSGYDFLALNGTHIEASSSPLTLIDVLRQGVLGLSHNIRDFNSDFDSMASWLRDSVYLVSGYDFLDLSGDRVTSSKGLYLIDVMRQGFLGLRTILNNGMRLNSGYDYLALNGAHIEASSSPLTLIDVLRQGVLGLSHNIRDFNSDFDSMAAYLSNTVFPWQSFNMQTHQLNASANISGQNDLFLTAFQSVEDKLGRLAYVFGSDEDLALKDAADPSTDAFRQDFGGGASLSDIKDSAELATSVPQLMDSGFDFGDAIEEIGSNDDFLKWFSAETWAALDSTGNAVAADPDYLSDYYDNLRKVEEKRHWGD